MHRRVVGLALTSCWLTLATASNAQSPPFESNNVAGADFIFIDGLEPAAPSRPTAAAGADQNVAVRATVTLDGSGSRDSRGRSLTFRWTLESRPHGSDAGILDAMTARPWLVPDVRGSYLVALVVSDGSQDSLPDRVLVRAFDNFGIDSDADGLGDALERSLGLDPFNEDSFGDGIRDADRDLDSDGLTIRQELLIGTDPLNADTDANGVNDGNDDADRDDLGNLREFQLGTRPLSRDTDADGWHDGAEVDGLSNPLDPQSRPRLAFTMPISGLSVVRVGMGDAGELALNTVATVPVSGHGLVRVAQGDAGGLSLNTAVAAPLAGHTMTRVAAGEPGGLAPNTVVAHPPATLRRQE